MSKTTLIEKAYRVKNANKLYEVYIRWKSDHSKQTKAIVNRSKSKNKTVYRGLNVLRDERRRSLQDTLPNDFSTDDWKRCLDYFDNRCAVCNRREDTNVGLFIAADHWNPLDLSNIGTVSHNVVPLCHTRNRLDTIHIEAGCNNKKGKHDPIEWLSKRYDEITAEEILRRIETYFEWAAATKAEIEVEKKKEREEIRRIIESKY